MLILSLLITKLNYGQTEKAFPKTTVGFELDFLPYLTGGYYGSVWVGHDHFRYRAVIAKVKKPDFLVADGFTNNKITAYAAIIDYFFKSGFDGWWIGGGGEYWQGEIQADTKQETGKYDNAILTLGGGYVWKFYRNFYLNPWAAIHARIAGDSNVAVDGKEFHPPLLTPELSLKVGWHF